MTHLGGFGRESRRGPDTWASEKVNHWRGVLCFALVSDSPVYKAVIFWVLDYGSEMLKPPEVALGLEDGPSIGRAVVGEYNVRAVVLLDNV